MKKNKALKNINKKYKHELDKFNIFFDSFINSDVKLLNKTTKHITQKKGKQLRPLLVLLSFLSCGGRINKKIYQAMTLIELLHVATLVHDDVIDEAEKRRSLFTLHKLWNNKIAILTGDYLLANSLVLIGKTKEQKIITLLSNTLKKNV